MSEKELLQTVTAKMAGQEMMDKEKVISLTVELMREMPLERVRCLCIHALTWAQINGKAHHGKH